MAALDVDDDGRLTGINDRTQLAAAEWDMRVEIERPLDARRRHDGRPVHRLPRRMAWSWPQDVTLEPNVILRGSDPDRASGRGSRPARQIIDSRHRRATAWSGRASSSARPWRTTSPSGPFSHLRPGAPSGRGSEIGNYAEIKNSRLGDARPPAPHELPRRRRGRRGHERRAPAPSPPTTTASRKHRTTIGERVFLGRRHDARRARRPSATTRKTGAGAVVTQTCPPGKLAVRHPRPHARAAPEPGSAPKDARRPADRATPRCPRRSLVELVIVLLVLLERDLRRRRDRAGVHPAQPRRAAGGGGAPRRPPRPAPHSATRAGSSP